MRDDMGDFKRIDPASVPAIFGRIGVLPQQRGFFGGYYPEPRACLLSAKFLEKCGGDKARLIGILKANQWQGFPSVNALAGELGLPTEYAAGLTEGWDGNAGNVMESHPEFLLGIEDGRVAWEACQPLLTKGA